MQNVDFGEVLRHMMEVPNDLFPSMLFNPVINDFGEEVGKSYWTDFDESNELIDRAMTIGGKKKDLLSYLDDMDVYTEYMEALAEKYGSIELVEMGAEEGLIPEFVPKRPVLKKTKRNKMLVRAGIIPSRQLFRPTLIGYYGFMKSEFQSGGWQEIDETAVLATTDKETKKEMKEYRNRMMIRDRMQMFTSSRSRNDALAQISEIYASLENGGYRQKGVNNDFISLTQLKKERKKMEQTPDWILDEITDSSSYGITKLYSGRLVDSSKARRMQIIHDLIDIGFDPYRLGVSGGITKKEINLVISNFDGEIPENVKSGKVWKKMEKKRAKARKEAAKKVSQNPALARILQNGIFSFDDQEKLTNWGGDNDD